MFRRRTQSQSTIDFGREAASFRARQLQAIVDLTPWIVLTNIVNALMSAYFISDVWPRWIALTWCAAVMLVSCTGVPLWRATRKQPLQTVSRRTTSKVVGHGIVLASLWALVPATAFHLASHAGQLFIVGMATGMLCGGGFALATMLKAANAYITVLAVGAAVGALHLPLNAALPLLAVLVVYVLIIFKVAASMARSFRARLAAEFAAGRQQEFVSLLLNDFQEHTSDWLWETDAQGRLCNVSLRLATLLDVPTPQLEGKGLVSLLVERSWELEATQASLDGIGRLQAALLGDKPFRGLHLSVLLGGAWRHWQISGKPQFGKDRQVIGWHGVGSDITATHEAHVEVRRLASTDEVTGLANRHEFKRALRRVGSEPAALFCLDLDNFKAVNDVHGHAVGDDALKVVADRLLKCIRPSDLLARVGGDEFALLRFENTDRAELELDAKRICKALQQPCQVGSLRLTLGTSIGIAVAPQNADTGEALLRCTDLAVYAAKDAGRGTWRFYTPSMGEQAARRHILHDDLREGLLLEQFSVHYQPQFDADNGRLIGAEALLRWRHPQRGNVSPQEFIAAAEESGVMSALGRWVMQRACEAATRWPDTIRVAINVSAQQLVQPRFVRQVREVLDATGLPAGRLELELTETALIENTAVAMSAIVRLRELGVRVALDDFGTGYSSLAYLRRFPFDKIKIDPSFVVGITQDPGALAIVTAVVRLASALQLDVTAEGVESDDQMKLLRQLGCTSLQGYLFARPMPEDNMRQYVATEHLVAGLPGAAFRRIHSVTGERVT